MEPDQIRTEVGVIPEYLRQEHKTSEQSGVVPCLLEKGSRIC